MNRPYQLIVTVILLSLTISACKQSVSEIKNDIDWEKDIKALTYLKEVEWSKAYADSDTTLLDRILGDDFQMIDNQGNWTTKSDEMGWIKNNEFSNDSFFYEIKRLEILTNGTAIVCGTGHMINDSIETIYQSSNVLEKRNGEWKAVLSHVSGIKNN